jgi:Flp pilus assembly protein TadB
MSDHESQEGQQNRIRQARQVLAGDSIRPSPDPWVLGNDAVPLSPLQRNYLVTLIILLLLGVLLAWIIGLGVASIVLFVLALGLIASWLVF